MRASRTEAELLLCCARSSREDEIAERLEALTRQEVDWGHLLRLADRHRMMPLLHWHLDGLFLPTVPTTVLEQLQGHFQANNLRNLLLTRELLRILEEFERNGVAAVPYKGPVLAASIYGNLALREFIDLDVLVHERDILRARKLLTSLGYRQETPLTPAQEAAFLKTQREYEFVHDNGSLVELHWAVTPHRFSVPLDPESLWERLEDASLGGNIVPTFSPEDLLLILCVHGSKHVWYRLAWICDIAELIRAKKAMDWNQLMKRADRLGSTRMLFLGLSLAKDLLGAPLPHVVSQRVQADPAVKPLAKQVRRWLFQEVEGAPDILRKTLAEEYDFHSFRIKVRERLRDKVLYCVRTALGPTLEDWTLLPLPKLLFPLYYVIRPIRLGVKSGQRILVHR